MIIIHTVVLFYYYSLSTRDLAVLGFRISGQLPFHLIDNEIQRVCSVMYLSDNN